MFVGMGSSVVCLVALILFQKLRGLLVLAASSLACNSTVALRFIFLSGQSLAFSLCPPEVIQCYGTVRVFCTHLAKCLTSFFLRLHSALNQGFWERVLLCVYWGSVSHLNMSELWSGIGL